MRKMDRDLIYQWMELIRYIKEENSTWGRADKIQVSLNPDFKFGSLPKHRTVLYPTFNLNNKLWLELTLTPPLTLACVWRCGMRHKSHKISPCHLRHFIWISTCTKCTFTKYQHQTFILLFMYEHQKWMNWTQNQVQWIKARWENQKSSGELRRSHYCRPL